MRQLVEFGLNDGGMILVEVHETASATGPVTRDLCGGQAIERARQTVEDAVQREAAAAVRPGPAAPFRLTALVVSAGHMPGPVARAGAAASFRLRIAGPVGPCRVSLEW